MRQLWNGLAIVLTLIGALNWGAIGLFRYNLVRRMFGRATMAERIAYQAIGLAGIWLALAFALPRAFIVFGVRGYDRSAAWQAEPITGKTMPIINGRTLSGQAISIPGDILGKCAFLAMGFAYETRFDVERWAEAARERFGTREDVLFFEMPIIDGVYRLFEPTIQAGMRLGTPASEFDNVVTVYGADVGLRRSLGATPDTDTWIYLLDKNGTVVFQYGGEFDRQKFEEMASILETALQGPGSLDSLVA